MPSAQPFAGTETADTTLPIIDERTPREAFLSLATSAPEPAASYIRELLFRRWAEAEPAAAVDYAERLPMGGGREALMAALAFVVAKTNPQEAAALATEELADGTSRTETFAAIAHQWALRDAPEAIKWADSLPAGVLRERVRREIAGFTPTGARVSW